MAFNIEMADLVICFEFSHKTWEIFFREKYKAFLASNQNKAPKWSIRIEPQKSINNFSFSRPVGENKVVLRCPPDGFKKFVALNYFLKLFYAAVLYERGGFIFHASAVKRGNFAFLFLGPIKVGKSTIARALPFSWRIADDAAIVRNIKNKFFVFCGPLYEKNKIKKRKLRLPVKRVFFIYQAKKNKLEKLSSKEAIGQLVKNMKGVIVGDKKEDWGDLWKLAANFSRRVESFNLFFTEGKTLKDFLIQKCLQE